MGATELLRALKIVLEEITAGMLLKVNPDTGEYEEDHDMPVEPGDDYEIPDLDPDQEPPEGTRERLSQAQEWPQEEKRRPPHIYLMNLPEREDVYSNIPYLLVQIYNKHRHFKGDRGVLICRTAL